MLAIGVGILVACWLDLSHDMVEELPHFHGKTEVEIIQALGQPDERHEVRPYEGLPEFYVEIHNTYPAGDPKSEGVVVRELRWNYARHHVSLFLHKPAGEWIVLDSVRWQKGVAF